MGDAVNNGYIFIHRKIMETSFYKNSLICHLAIHCILRANYKDTKILLGKQELTLQRGQFITGRKALAYETGLSEQNVRTALQTLSDAGFLTIKPTNRFSIITICNYEEYQPLPEQTNQQLTSKNSKTNQQSAKINQQINQQTNQQIISEKPLLIIHSDGDTTSANQQTNQQTNQQSAKINQQTPSNSTTDNNIKNNKKNKKIFIRPTVDEIKAYCEERDNGIDAEAFYDFYEAKGWMIGKNKMKDWKAAVRTWERNNRKQQQEEEDDGGW